jgi:RNA polymerase sigma-70 factor (ECF subfamily)
LRYLQELSYQEIADTLELPLNTVKSYLFRARQQLQELLYDYQEGGVKG